MGDLRDRIKERISAQGKITFAQFMEMALYWPGLGYYTTSVPRVGAEGDFYTSPATHPVFAALIALQLEQMWQRLGCPADFTMVEMGAGKGLLARDMLAYLPHLSPSFDQCINYIAMERDGVFILRGAAPPSAQGKTFVPVQGITGCFLSNELLDAFPAHKVMMRDGRLQEIYVSVEGDKFVEVVDEPSTPLLEEQLAREGIALPEGYCTEINLNIGPWMAAVATSLERGFVITIDYGYLAKELYAPEKCQGTLLTYYKHTCGSDPYVRIGQQDMTTHVDFAAAIQAGERAGLRFEALICQREFLLNLGLDIFLQALVERGLSYQEYLANRFAMLELMRPEGMGDFKVLIQSKGVAAGPLYGTTSDEEGKQMLRAKGKALAVPLLGEEHMPLLQGKYPQYTGILEGLFDFRGQDEDT
jgi:SAM-dependent MidA family methyltransferase